MGIERMATRVAGEKAKVVLEAGFDPDREGTTHILMPVEITYGGKTVSDPEDGNMVGSELWRALAALGLETDYVYWWPEPDEYEDPDPDWEEPPETVAIGDAVLKVEDLPEGEPDGERFEVEVSVPPGFSL